MEVLGVTNGASVQHLVDDSGSSLDISAGVKNCILISPRRGAYMERVLLVYALPSLSLP